MAELKPCPFCGGEVELFKDSGRWFVQCKGKCGAYFSHWKGAEWSAAKAWNERVSDGEKID